jgi:hypothetical protein
VIVCAETGCTDNANPVTSDVMTNPRRDHCDRGSNPSNPASTMSITFLPWRLSPLAERKISSLDHRSARADHQRVTDQ